MQLSPLSFQVVESIHAHLRSLADDIKANKIPLMKYIITKGLTKNPSDYPDAKNQPHVQVALAMLKAGKAVKAGDFVPYVICVDAAAAEGSGTGALSARRSASVCLRSSILCLSCFASIFLFPFRALLIFSCVFIHVPLSLSH